MYHVDKGSTEETELHSISVDISVDDLEMTTNLLEPKVMIFKPESDNTSFDAKLMKENVFYVLGFHSGTKIGLSESDALTVDEVDEFILRKFDDENYMLIKKLDDITHVVTATNTLKPAKLETGAEIRVPLFINEGDKIKVDTRDGSYSERVKG